MGRGHERARLAHHAHEQLVVLRARIAPQTDERLGHDADALRLERPAQAARDLDIVIAANDAKIALLVDLDPTTAAILGRPAGSFGRGERLGQLGIPGRDTRDAEGYRHAGAQPADVGAALADGAAQLLGHAPGL